VGKTERKERPHGKQRGIDPTAIVFTGLGMFCWGTVPNSPGFHFDKLSVASQSSHRLGHAGMTDFLDSDVFEMFNRTTLRKLIPQAREERPLFLPLIPPNLGAPFDVAQDMLCAFAGETVF
jgi:hypothetical protein